MNQCDRFRKQLADYVVGALHGKAHSRVEMHLRGCAACRAEVAALERTGALLDGAGLKHAPETTWQAISASIVQPARIATRRLRWVWSAAASAFALALIMVAFLLLRPVGQPTTIGQPLPAEEEMSVALQEHVPAMWAAPLSDETAIGLRFASAENGG